MLAGDVVLLASDGVNTLETEVIARIVSECGDSSAATIAARLISSVDAAAEPHQDNTTIIAIRVLETKPADHV